VPTRIRNPHYLWTRKRPHRPTIARSTASRQYRSIPSTSDHQNLPSRVHVLRGQGGQTSEDVKRRIGPCSFQPQGQHRMSLTQRIGHSRAASSNLGEKIGLESATPLVPRGLIFLFFLFCVNPGSLISMEEGLANGETVADGYMSVPLYGLATSTSTWTLYQFENLDFILDDRDAYGSRYT
jgi:hypothetical protein